MKKQKIYVLFSHGQEDTEYKIHMATTEAKEILNKWNELGLVEIYNDFHDIPLTHEILQHKNILDTPYMDDNRRYVLDTFDIEVPKNKEIYAVIINGKENFWLADMHGVFKSKEDAIDFIKYRLQEWEITDNPEEYCEGLEERNSMIDPQSMFWDIIRFNIE